MTERRRHQRIKTENPLSYVCLDGNGIPVDQGVGRALNLSKGGLLIETKVPIEAYYVKLTSIGMKNELIKIKTKIVYCREEEPKNFYIGVSFIETNERIREIIKGMIKVYSMQNYRRCNVN